MNEDSEDGSPRRSDDTVPGRDRLPAIDTITGSPPASPEKVPIQLQAKPGSEPHWSASPTRPPASVIGAERLAALRARIESGGYRIDARRIAKRMLELERVF